MLALSGLAVGVAGTATAALAHLRLARVRRECSARARQAQEVAGGLDPRAIRNVAVMRYDAFRDMGGLMSFSLALLDASGDGVVLSSINAHSETRTYAKVIHGGDSTQTLSPEERQVLARARDGIRDRPGEPDQSVAYGFLGDRVSE